MGKEEEWGWIIIKFIVNKIIIQLMDSVHEADEPGDIGVCHEHNRVFECYCNQCYWYQLPNAV